LLSVYGHITNTQNGQKVSSFLFEGIWTGIWGEKEIGPPGLPKRVFLNKKKFLKQFSF